MLPGPAVPGCSLVSFHILWAILCPQAVNFFVEGGCEQLQNCAGIWLNVSMGASNSIKKNCLLYDIGCTKSKQRPVL